MNTLVVAAVLLVLAGIAYQSGWSRARGLATADGVKVHSRPTYHGAYVAIWALVRPVRNASSARLAESGFTLSAVLRRFQCSFSSSDRVRPMMRSS